MVSLSDSFNQGPEAVFQFFSGLHATSAIDEMDAKRLADNCWTRANTLVRSQVQDARQWARAALAGYDFLSKFGQPAAARSATENAAALRSWKLLRDDASNPAPAPA